MIAGHQVRIDVLLVLALPRLERGELRKRSRIAHPLNRLIIGHKVHVLVAQQLVDESLKDAEILLLFEPNGVEVDAERSSVRFVVTVKVGHEHVVHFLFGQMGRTRVDHSASVPFNVQRIHHHFPHAGERARRTLLARSTATMRNTIVERVRPQRRIRLRSHHRRIVQEAELFHHDELRVPADAKERHTSATNFVQRNAGKLVNDVGHSGKLIEPIFDRGVKSPPQFRLFVTTF